jgi:hypothetical protein
LTAFVTHWFTTPACTTMRRFARSMASIAWRRLVQIITVAPTGNVPPERPVPAPRGTNGTPSAASRRTTSATDSGVRGRTTTSGAARSSV